MANQQLQIEIQINGLAEWQQTLMALEKAAAEMQTALTQLNQLKPIEFGTINRKADAERTH